MLLVYILILKFVAPLFFNYFSFSFVLIFDRSITFWSW